MVQPVIMNAPRDFPEGTVVKTLPSNAGSTGLISGRGAKILHALGPKKTKHKIEAVLEQIQ